MSGVRSAAVEVDVFAVVQARAAVASDSHRARHFANYHIGTGDAWSIILIANDSREDPATNSPVFEYGRHVGGGGAC